MEKSSMEELLQSMKPGQWSQELQGQVADLAEAAEADLEAETDTNNIAENYPGKTG